MNLMRLCLVKNVVILQAWGVRKITMLDSGKVAMSNPLRQSLYTLDDSLNGGEFKAIAATRSLKRIFPAVVINLVPQNELNPKKNGFFC